MNNCLLVTHGLFNPLNRFRINLARKCIALRGRTYASFYPEIQPLKVGWRRDSDILE